MNRLSLGLLLFGDSALGVADKARLLCVNTDCRIGFVGVLLSLLLLHGGWWFRRGEV